MPFGVAVVFNVLMVLVVDTTSEVLKDGPTSCEF